ncbi:MAG: DNA polymerase III subunit [Fibrobacter sp.]|jgi:DNA polymerase-3 subunit delta'|nr:DNA polymerase III subunit [Fibrobacter sp.]
MIEYELKGPLSQQRTRIRLGASLKENHFPQAVIIEGLPGIGKKALAMELSKALCCTNASQRPCGECFGCKMSVNSGAVENWVIPLESKEAKAKKASDVSEGSSAKTVEEFTQVYIQKIIENPYSIDYLSAAAEISVDLIRSLTGRFSLKNDRVRCVIIAEADRMNESASNALLKTLEEVPPNTYFILTTSSKEQLLQTIRSRCLSIHLPPLSSEEVRDLASQYVNIPISDDVLGLSQGSVGRAIYYASKATELQDLALEFLESSISGNYSDLFFNLDSEELKDPAVAILFLEVLSFLITDIVRDMSGAPLRLAETTRQFKDKENTPLDLNAYTVALQSVQETMYRIGTRRTSALVCLQSLAIKLFDGFR